MYSILMNWLQSIRWGAEGERFSDKSRKSWHPPNRINHVPSVGTPFSGVAPGVAAPLTPRLLISPSGSSKPLVFQEK